MKRRGFFGYIAGIFGGFGLFSKKSMPNESVRLGRDSVPAIECSYWDGIEKNLSMDEYSLAMYRKLPDGTILLTRLPKKVIKEIRQWL